MEKTFKCYSYKELMETDFTDDSIDVVYNFTKIDKEKIKIAITIFRDLLNNTNKKIYIPSATTLCHWLLLEAPHVHWEFLYTSFKAIQGHVWLKHDHYDDLIQICVKEIVDKELTKERGVGEKDE